MTVNFDGAAESIEMPAGWQDGKWHSISVWVSGNVKRAWIDGAEVLTQSGHVCESE